MAIVVRPSARCVERPRDAHLGERVDRRRRLVEHEHVGVGDAGPQQGDELALARRQLLAALADLASSARRAALSTQSPRSRRSTTASIVGERRPGPGEADVGGDRVVEQERLLRHDDEAPAQLVVGDVVQRHAAEADLADRRVGEAGDEAAERRLAGTGRADHAPPAGRPGCAALTWRSTAASTVVGDAAGRVGERDVADVDVERARRQRRAVASGGGGPTGRSSTPSTRRSPATAVWVWSSTSVNSAIGSRNR